MKLLNMKQIGLIIILSLSVFNIGFASGVNKKTTEFKKAEAAFQDMKFSIAAGYYKTYIDNTPDIDNHALTNLAECYWQMRQLDDALKAYKSLYPNGKENVDVTIQQRIGELYARNNEYDKAAEWLAGVPGYEEKANIYRQEQKIESFKKDSIAWKLYALNLNTEYREFAPCLDDNILFFSSNKVPNGNVKSYGWDGDNFSQLWLIPVSDIDSIRLGQLKNKITQKTAIKKTIRLADVYENGDNKSKKDNSRIITSTPKLKNDSSPMGSLVGKLNRESYNTGTIAIDANKHVYFSANYPKADKSGMNRIRIMEGNFKNNAITDIKEMPFGDPKSYSVMHPAINNEGTMLVFSSNKPNGKEGYDLYYTLKSTTDNSWSEPKQFLSNINTIGNEVFPSISKKGILYYSSDVLPGLGGLDIYKIALSDAIAGTVNPEHLSYPINSEADDFGMSIDSSGVNGYFTSDRLNNNDNIYGFNYQAHIGLNLITGKVIDKITMWPLENATVFVWEKNTDKVMVAKTNENGEYLVPITSAGNYQIKSIKKEFSKDCLTMPATVKKGITDNVNSAPRDLALDNFEIGLKIQIDNIHYDFDKSFIRADAKPILDSLVTVLNRYPIKVELSSHTDSRGPIVYNEKLSQRRADSAVKYLISKGIDTNRITAKGSGERQLLNRCSNGVKCTAAEHQANRRTEVKVTGFTVSAPVLEVPTDRFSNGQIISIKDLPANFFDSCK